MRTKEEILADIEIVEDHMFSIDMIDHWSKYDSDLYYKYMNKKRDLYKELKEVREAEKYGIND